MADLLLRLYNTAVRWLLTRLLYLIETILALLVATTLTALCILALAYFNFPTTPLAWFSITVFLAIATGSIWFDLFGFTRREKRRQLEGTLTIVKQPVRREDGAHHEFDFDPEFSVILAKPLCAAALDTGRGLVRFIFSNIYEMRPELCEPGYFGEIADISFRGAIETSQIISRPKERTDGVSAASQAPTIRIRPKNPATPVLELIFRREDSAIAQQWAEALTKYRDRFIGPAMPDSINPAREARKIG